MLGHRTLNVEDYVAIIKRRWWIIVIPAIIFPIMTYMFTFTIEPQYLSQTLVLIEQQQVPTDYVRPVINEDLDSRLASMREQILSRSSIEPIIKNDNLYGNKKISMDDKIDLMRKGIEIRAIHSDIARSNGLPGFFISFKASDATTAQQVCSEITSLFVKQNLLSRAAAVDQTTEFLRSQLADAKRILDDQDGKLAAFQRQYFGKLPTDETTNVNILSTLDARLEAATQAINQMDQQQTYYQALLAQQTTQVSSGGAVVQSPQAQESQLQTLERDKADLLLHYTADNPDVKSIQRRIDDLQKKMADTAAAPLPPPTPSTSPATHVDNATAQDARSKLRVITAAKQQKQAEQAQLESQIKNYQARVQGTPEVEEEYKELTRDMGQAQDNYNQLLAKITQSRMATELEKRQEGEQFKIMDQANLPDSPMYPKKQVFVLGGLVAGLGLGLLIVALLEYKNTSLRSERDIWAFTQLPTLAVIAWSGEVAHVKPSRFERIKRLLRLGRRKELLADSSG